MWDGDLQRVGRNGLWLIWRFQVSHGAPLSLVFSGKSQSKMGDLGVPTFMESSISCYHGQKAK